MNRLWSWWSGDLSADRGTIPPLYSTTDTVGQQTDETIINGSELSTRDNDGIKVLYQPEGIRPSVE